MPIPANTAQAGEGNPEIGPRRTVGARPGHIAAQLLADSRALGTPGGPGTPSPLTADATGSAGPGRAQV